MRLDHCQGVGDSCQAAKRFEWILHVIQHAKEQRHVKCAEPGDVHHHEVIDHHLGVAAQRAVRDVKGDLPRQRVWALEMRYLNLTGANLQILLSKVIFEVL